MEYINEFQCSILKKIRKFPNGMSPEQLKKAFAKKSQNESGVETALSELVKEGFLKRTESDEDRVRGVLDLPVNEFTGDYLLTNKAYAYLTNQNFENGIRLRDAFWGFVTGVVSAFLIQLLSKLIDKI